MKAEDIILERDIYLFITSKGLLHKMQALRCASGLSHDVFHRFRRRKVSGSIRVLNLLFGFSDMKNEEIEESTTSYFKAAC